MPRYEVHEERAQSYWEITLAGKTYTIRWGRVGSSGQSRVKHFPSDEQARRAYERQIAAKRAIGYKLVEGTEEPGAFARVGEPAAIARNAELEAAVIENPSEDAALLVLGDWLESQGDPRGTLIALQHAQAQEKDPTRFLALKRDAAAFYAQHEAALLGPIDPYRHLFKLDWYLGYLRGVRLSFAAARPGDPTPAELVARIGELPSAVAWQELAIGTVAARASRYGDVLVQLCTTGEPRTLRALHLGDHWPGTPTPNPGFLGDAGALGARFPRLRKLVIAHGNVGLDTPFPELRTFDQRAVINEDDLRWLRATTLPQLEHLHLATGRYADHLRAVLDPRRLPQLRQLRLTDGTDTEGVVQMIAGSPLLPQLELVDVTDGSLDDEAAARVLERLAPFRHLKLFRLGQQRVTYNMYLRLRDAGVDIKLPRAYQG